MTIQQMLLGTGLPLVLPLTDVDIFADQAYLPPNPPLTEARYAITGGSDPIAPNSAMKPGIGVVTPDVLPQLWLPDGANPLDYRARFTVVSRNPSNTVVTFGAQLGDGTWFTPGHNTATFVEVSSANNTAVSQIYEAVVRADIALASNLSNVLGGATVTLRMRRRPA